nr:MAG TPA: hypothetical protein [Caudoviricetes sp.]
MYHQGSLYFLQQNAILLLLENFHYNQQTQDRK